MFRRAISMSRDSAFRSKTKKTNPWADIAPLDTEKGALLLLDFKTIAAGELQNTSLEIPTIPTVVPRIAALIPSHYESESDTREERDVPPVKRPRTVSVSFDEAPLSPLPTSSTFSCDSSEGTPSSPGSPTYESTVGQVTPDTRKPVLDLSDNIKQVEALISRPSPSKLVGTEVKGSVKAVLQRKFSWKNYPALEAYLVKHREEYLQYSSELNYTAEQKRYNNTLTQGLLDLAEEEGYLFEDFTFSAIRDRIRCYYKSYVQATKKKKKRKRGSF